MSWGFYFTLTYFIGPMTADLGWSSTEFSTVQFLSSICFSLALPLIGRYVDQYGGRGLMIAGGVIGAFGIASVAYVTQIWQFYLVMGVVVPLAMAMYGSVVTGVALANWFHRKRGRAFAVASMGTSAGGVIFGPLASVLIVAIGWRETWLVFAAIILVGITVPAYLFMERRPEDVGLRPDGDAPEFDRTGAAMAVRTGPAPGEPVWTRNAALATPTFWLLALSFSMGNMVIGAFLLHVIPFLRTNGLTAAQATLVATSFSAVLVLIKPFYGIALERFPSRSVCFLSFVGSSVAILAMVVFRQPAFLIVAVLGYAVTMGGAIPTEDVTWANYFGRWTLGQIRGVAYPIEAILGSIGPLIGAIAFDATGGYSGAFVIFAGAYGVAAVGILAARHPTPRTRVAIPPIRKPRPVGAFAGVRAFVIEGGTPAAVASVMSEAERGARRVVGKPRVRRSLPVLLASAVGLSAGLLVTLVSVPPNRKSDRRVPTAPAPPASAAPRRRAAVAAAAARVAAGEALRRADLAGGRRHESRPALNRATVAKPSMANVPVRSRPAPAKAERGVLDDTLRGMRRDRDAVASFVVGLFGKRRKAKR